MRVKWLPIILCFFSLYAQDEQEGVLLKVHKLTYFHPYSYTTSDQDAGKEAEVKYQISLKTALIGNGGPGSLFFAYSQKSIWQIYNDEASAPFRETNYNPEVFMRFGSPSLFADFGYSHESNGQQDPESRGWDQFYLTGHLKTEYINIYLRSWYVFAEDQSVPSIVQKNTSIIDYYGYGQLGITLKLGTMFIHYMARHNFKTHFGAHESNISFPLGKGFYLHFQHFSGYGDTLIDYNHSTNRYGVGLLLNR